MQFGHLLKPFEPHTSRSLLNGLPFFLPLFGLSFFILLSNLLQNILFICCNHFLLYSCTLLKKWGYIYLPCNICIGLIICPNVSCCFSHIFLLLLLLFFLRLIVVTFQFSLPYNKSGSASVLYSFILVVFKVFCGLSILLIMSV